MKIKAVVKVASIQASIKQVGLEFTAATTPSTSLVKQLGVSLSSAKRAGVEAAFKRLGISLASSKQLPIVATFQRGFFMIVHNVDFSDGVTMPDVWEVSFSKDLIETVSVSSLTQMHSTLNKGDNYSVSDISALHPELTKAEVIGVQDVFTKITSFNLSPSDAFTLDDAALVDKDYYGIKGNILTFDEVVSLAMVFSRSFTDAVTFSDLATVAASKPLSETLTVSELTSKASNKPLSDNLTFSELVALTHAFSRSFSDAFTLDDEALIDKDYYGNKSNLIGFNEIFSQGIGKPVTDSTTLQDVPEIGTSVPKTDNVAMSDGSVISSNIGPSDNASLRINMNGRLLKY